MILEEEQKIEVIDDVERKKSEDFKQIPNNTKSKHWIIVLSIFIIAFLVFFILIFAIFTIYNYNNNSTIANGIYINGIDVSNLSKQEAKEKLEKYYSEKLSNDITLVHGSDYTTYIKTSEIDLNINLDSAINYAYQCGKTSNIFEDNYQIFNAMLNGINIEPTVSFNEESLKKILNNLSSELPDAIVESGYYIDGNNLFITKGTNGVIIDANSTAKKIEERLQNLNYVNEIIEIDTISASPKKIDLESIYNEVHKDAKDATYIPETHTVTSAENGVDFKVSLEEANELLQNSDSECTIPLKVLKPSVTNNMIGQEAFPDLLASYSTKYAASNTNRTTNLRLAAEKIDGTVLLPGETFSYNNVVGERTISAGYKDAAIYSNGKVVDGLGGGICQISTTLFNAVLYSNLEIVELHNHQFIPSYATAGRDATVVYGVKDFQFKNSRKYAIKITCSVSKGIASFQIWGFKEDPEYDIEVSANVTSRTSSYIKSATYRIVKLNGQTVKTEKISNYTYKTH